MQSGRRYSIGAGIADFYVAGTILGAFSALYVAIIGRPLGLRERLLLLAFNLTLTIGYHSLVARQVAFRTVGEVMMGRIITEGRKCWTNPFGANRAALFAVLFVGLIMAGNAWDSVGSERFYTTLTLPVVLGRIVLIGSLLVGTVMVGQAQLRGGLLVAGYFVLSTVASLLKGPPSEVSPNITRVLALSNMVTLIIAGAVLARYHCLAADKPM